MKKFLITIFACIGIIGIARADTIDINWLNEDGTTYDTSTCTVGGDVILPTTPTKYGYTFQGWARYIPIEYIESTGTQYIDTGVVSTGYTIEISFMLTNINSSIFGYNYNDNGTQRRQSLMFSTSRNVSVFGFGDGGNGYEDLPALSTDVLYNVKAGFSDDIYCDINGTIQTFGFVTRSNPISAFIMGTNNQTTSGISSYMKLYYAKIWDNGALVRDFIPVLDHNGVACMYDKVSEQFFYNSGTGNFNAGAIITE